MDSLGSFESFFHQLVPFGEGDQQLMLSLYQQQQQLQQGGAPQLPSQAQALGGTGGVGGAAAAGLSNLQQQQQLQLFQLQQLQQQQQQQGQVQIPQQQPNGAGTNTTTNPQVQLQLPQVLNPQYYTQQQQQLQQQQQGQQPSVIATTAQPQKPNTTPPLNSVSPSVTSTTSTTSTTATGKPKKPSKKKGSNTNNNNTPTTNTATTPTTTTQSPSSTSSTPITTTPKTPSTTNVNTPQQHIDRTPTSPISNFQDSDSDDEDAAKKNRSRHNQNLASRNYRQRKKEYIRDIEEKLAVLALENDKLKKENVSLKKGGGVEIMKPDPAFITMMMEAKQIIIQLDVAIKKNDERSLIYLLQLFHISIEKRHSIVEKEVEKMVHPYTQAKLAAMGYVPSLENPMISSMSGPSSDNWWSRYMTAANITDEQAKAIKELRSNHWKADLELRNEREKLDRSIKEFYLTKVMVFPTNERLNKSFAANNSITDAPIPQPMLAGPIGDNHNVDISEILEFTRKLEALKKNFVKQRTLMEDTHSALSSILTPKQEAMLLVRVHSSSRYDFANMEMLKNVWGSVISKDAAYPPPPPHFPQSLLNQFSNAQSPQLLSQSPQQPPNFFTMFNNNNNTHTTDQQQQQQQQLPSPQQLSSPYNTSSTSLPIPSPQHISQPQPQQQPPYTNL